jgi:hypothetical protein
MGILNFKGLTARRLYKSFGVKGLMNTTLCPRDAVGAVKEVGLHFPVVTSRLIYRTAE